MRLDLSSPNTLELSLQAECRPTSTGVHIRFVFRNFWSNETDSSQKLSEYVTLIHHISNIYRSLHPMLSPTDHIQSCRKCRPLSVTEVVHLGMRTMNDHRASVDRTHVGKQVFAPVQRTCTGVSDDKRNTATTTMLTIACSACTSPDSNKDMHGSTTTVVSLISEDNSLHLRRSDANSINAAAAGDVRHVL